MTHPDKDNQAERADFEAWATSQGHMIDSVLETGGRMYVSGFTRRAWDVWQAARAASPALGAEGLPPLPQSMHSYQASSDSEFAANWKAAYTAEQVRQAQRDAVAVDRLAQASAKSASKTAETRMDTGFDAGAKHARQDQQPARGSIDTEAFREFAMDYRGADPAYARKAYDAMIAHINAWGGTA